MTIIHDRLAGMWRAEYHGEISPYCATEDEAEDVLVMLEDGYLWRDGGWVEGRACDLCGEFHPDSEIIHTEDGFIVGECCHDELRVTGYETEHDSETFYYVN